MDCVSKVVDVSENWFKLRQEEIDTALRKANALKEEERRRAEQCGREVSSDEVGGHAKVKDSVDCSEFVPNSGGAACDLVRLRLIDSPGVNDTALPLDKISERLDRAAEHAPNGIAAIAVVVKRGRFTKEQRSILDIVATMFGRDALKKFGFLVVTDAESREELFPHSAEGAPHDLPVQKDVTEVAFDELCSLVSDRVVFLQKDNWFRTTYVTRDHILKHIRSIVVDTNRKPAVGLQAIRCEAPRPRGGEEEG